MKGKKIRNNKETMGIVLRKDGNQTPVTIKNSDMDKFLSHFGDYSNVTINLDGLQIETQIHDIQRDTVLHNSIHVEFREIV